MDLFENIQQQIARPPRQETRRPRLGYPRSSETRRWGGTRSSNYSDRLRTVLQAASFEGGSGTNKRQHDEGTEDEIDASRRRIDWETPGEGGAERPRAEVVTGEGDTTTGDSNSATIEDFSDESDQAAQEKSRERELWFDSLQENAPPASGDYELRDTVAEYDPLDYATGSVGRVVEVLDEYVEDEATPLQRKRLDNEEDYEAEEDEDADDEGATTHAPESSAGASPALSCAASDEIAPLAEDTPSEEPFTEAEIDQRVTVKHVEGKGRCCFAARDYEPGSIIFVESPLLVALPELDTALWEAIKVVSDEEALDLPPIWHLAAICSSQMSEDTLRQLNERWIPDSAYSEDTGELMISKDVKRLHERIELPLSEEEHEHYLQIWRYNSFGHHVKSEGLVLYNRISLLAHDCASSASWHYGSEDAFILRARQRIRKGDEITISYIGDEDIFKATHLRRDKLAGWLFKCLCQRCANKTDFSRGFRCPQCGAGKVFFKTEKDLDGSSTVTSSSKCQSCLVRPSPAVIQQYLEFEAAYIARLEETDKSDVPDAENVYAEAQRVFNQHWILAALDTILFDGYREAKRWMEAAWHQQRRIDFATLSAPKASYTLAWLYEELGDALMSAREAFPDLPDYHKNAINECYEVAMNMLLILCGWRHEYTLAAHRKLQIASGNETN